MSALPTFKIIDGSIEWASKFAELCRQTYIATYARPELGITEDLFSDEVFKSPRIVRYFESRCSWTDTQRSWLAINHTGELVGVVAAQLYPDRCDMNSFYVKPGHQGHGIGHALYQKVLEFAGSLPIQVDVIEYVTDTIRMYEHWGFHIDKTREPFTYELVEWPDRARLNYRAIYMVKPGPNAL
jgi:GNAT superfamily N-acetyltransferase